MEAADVASRLRGDRGDLARDLPEGEAFQVPPEIEDARKRLEALGAVPEE